MPSTNSEPCWRQSHELGPVYGVSTAGMRAAISSAERELRRPSICFHSLACKELLRGGLAGQSNLEVGKVVHGQGVAQVLAVLMLDQAARIVIE